MQIGGDEGSAETRVTRDTSEIWLRWGLGDFWRFT